MSAISHIIPSDAPTVSEESNSAAILEQGIIAERYGNVLRDTLVALTVNDRITTKESEEDVRSQFAEFYKLTDNDLSAIEQNAVIAFDASFLLDLYRYSEPTAKKMFSVLEGLQNQIWLPHQCALEFHRNRLSVLGSLRSKHAELLSSVSKDGEALMKTIEAGCLKHPLLDAQRIMRPLRDALARVEERIRSVSEKHPKATLVLEDDPIWQRVERTFSGKIGPEYSEQELKKHEEDARTRFSKGIPPGFSDQKKDKPYGDYILWRQLLDICKERQRPAFFVTSDVKPDWWLEHRGQKHGALPELRKEFRIETGQEFHLYETTHFTQIYGPRFKVAPEQPIGEIRRIRDERTNNARVEHVIAPGRATELDRYIRNLLGHSPLPKHDIGIDQAQLARFLGYEKGIDLTRLRELQQLVDQQLRPDAEQMRKFMESEQARTDKLRLAAEQFRSFEEQLGSYRVPEDATKAHKDQ
jgi:hypothetical protein